MGAIYSLLELAYSFLHLRITHSAISNNTRDDENTLIKGNFDTIDSPASSSGLKNADIGDVDKRNIIVMCAGQRVDLDVFPDERVEVLRQDACEILVKKPNCMSIVCNGEILDVRKRIKDYKLRGGQVVNLIRNAP